MKLKEFLEKNLKVQQQKMLIEEKYDDKRIANRTQVTGRLV